MAAQGVILAASIVVPLILEWVNAWKGDPEADALSSLQRLQSEQEQEFLFREASRGRREEELQADYSPPVGRILQEQSLVSSGLRDRELLQGSSLSQLVAEQMGMSAEDLRARLSPRRRGDLSDMAPGVETP